MHAPPPLPKSAAEKRNYQPGEVIAGKYRLIRILGEGGMGAVWEAINIGLDAPVAIKLIRSELEEVSARERLMTEARAAARLGHPAIVRVFDVGETEGREPFIVMELLQGESLGDMIEQKGRIPAVFAVQTLLPIADALAVAHSKRVVHRDIKPDNVFLAIEAERQVQPKLLDFGVVKVEQHDFGFSKLTQLGTLLGSPDYMSPEQARGEEDVDFRADIWAFSIVLYEALSGQTPFQGSNYNALLRSIVEDDPVPLLHHAAGDRELWEIIERGLQKDREQRWRSMFDLGQALADWLLRQGIEQDVSGAWLESKWLSPTSSQHPRQTLSSLTLEHSEVTNSWIPPRSGGRRRSSLGDDRPTLSPPPSLGGTLGSPLVTANANAAVSGATAANLVSDSRLSDEFKVNGRGRRRAAVGLALLAVAGLGAWFFVQHPGLARSAFAQDEVSAPTDSDDQVPGTAPQIPQPASAAQSPRTGSNDPGSAKETKSDAPVAGSVASSTPIPGLAGSGQAKSVPSSSENQESVAEGNAHAAPRKPRATRRRQPPRVHSPSRSSATNHDLDLKSPY